MGTDMLKISFSFCMFPYLLTLYSIKKIFRCSIFQKICQEDVNSTAHSVWAMSRVQQKAHIIGPDKPYIALSL